MRSSFLVLLLTLSLPAIVPSSASAQEVAEGVDRVGMNIRAEAEAIRHLAATIRREVEAGRVQLTEEAEDNWKRGKLIWDDIGALAKEDKYGAAYKRARDARSLMRKSFREAFTGKPSSAVTDALRAYVDAIKPRVSAVENQLENYEVTLEGRESFLVSKALWADAAKSAKKKKWDTAFRQLVDTLIELDKVIYEVYPTSR